MDSSGKEQEFANETSEWRNAYQREQEKYHGDSHQWLSAPQAVEIV